MSTSLQKISGNWLMQKFKLRRWLQRGRAHRTGAAGLLLAWGVGAPATAAWMWRITQTLSPGEMVGSWMAWATAIATTGLVAFAGAQMLFAAGEKREERDQLREAFFAELGAVRAALQDIGNRSRTENVVSASLTELRELAEAIDGICQLVTVAHPSGVFHAFQARRYARLTATIHADDNRAIRDQPDSVQPLRIRAQNRLRLTFDDLRKVDGDPNQADQVNPIPEPPPRGN